MYPGCTCWRACACVCVGGWCGAYRLPLKAVQPPNIEFMFVTWLTFHADTSPASESGWGEEGEACTQAVPAGERARACVCMCLVWGVSLTVEDPATAKHAVHVRDLAHIPRRHIACQRARGGRGGRGVYPGCICWRAHACVCMCGWCGAYRVLLKAVHCQNISFMFMTRLTSHADTSPASESGWGEEGEACTQAVPAGERARVYVWVGGVGRIAYR